MTIRAVVADPEATAAMTLSKVRAPDPSPGDAIVEAVHVSLNHGDLNDAVTGRVPPGGVLGSDVAGVVVRAAGDGRGPAAGSHVVGLAQGAFAEQVAVDAGSLAVVPESVDLAVAAALPVAGVAALRALRACGALIGKRVLVTGASGGVGNFAVQLAAAAGAHVLASVGSTARGAGLSGAGADEVLVGLDDITEPVDAVIDSVGGPQLVKAWSLLAPGGHLQSVGWTSGEPAVLEPYSTIGPPKSLSSYLTVGETGSDLTNLLRLVTDGAVEVPIGWQGSWEQIAEAAEALRQRRVFGKAVLDVQSPDRRRAQAL